jgi:hypothetical protein
MTERRPVVTRPTPLEHTNLDERSECPPSILSCPSLAVSAEFPNRSLISASKADVRTGIDAIAKNAVAFKRVAIGENLTPISDGLKRRRKIASVEGIN